MTQEEFKRNAEHAAPFLVPVPLTATAMSPIAPLGQVTSTDDWALGSFAGCAAVSCSVLFIFIQRIDQRFLSSRTRAQLVSQDLLISMMVM